PPSPTPPCTSAPAGAAWRSNSPPPTWSPSPPRRSPQSLQPRQRRGREVGGGGPEAVVGARDDVHPHPTAGFGHAERVAVAVDHQHRHAGRGQLVRSEEHTSELQSLAYL